MSLESCDPEEFPLESTLIVLIQMRKLARERSSGRTEKAHQRINALELEEIAFPASISVVRGGSEEGEKEEDRAIVRETTTKGGGGRRSLWNFSIYLCRDVLLSPSLSFPPALSYCFT